MFLIPRSWRRSINGLVATGCLLFAAGAASAIDIPVANTNNAGIGSLRDAIRIANLTPGTNNIVFLPGVTGTITLNNTLPAISSNVNIVGPGTNALTISGTNDRIFFVNSGTVQITNLTLANGVAQGGAGGTAAGGGLGAGGALFVNKGANVTIGGVSFGPNSAIGGGGGNAGTGTGALGGGGGGGLGRSGGNGGSGAVALPGAGAAGGSINNNGANSTTSGGAGGGGAGGNGGSATANGAGGGGGGSGIFPNSGNSGGGGAGGAAGANGSAGAANQGGGGGGSFNTSGVRGGNGGDGGANAGGGGGGIGLIAKGGDGGNGGFGAGGGGGGGKIALPNVTTANGSGGSGGYGGGGGAGGFSTTSITPATGGAGGFGAGNGGIAGTVGGGGGSALGGAVFVRQGGSLTLLDTDLAAGNSLSAGTGGAGAAAGTSGAIAGKGIYLDQVTLAFANTAPHTIADEIGGTGGVTVNGTSSVILTAANTYTGPTTVNSGILLVNGQIVSPVTVNQAGVLGGSGFVGTTILQNGGISPGQNLNSIGTLTVNGNFTQHSGAYLADINAAGQSDRVAVTGSAKIDGGIVTVLAANGNYYKGETFTIITAANGVSGRYTSILSNPIPGSLTPTLVYNPNNVEVVLTGQTPSGPNVTNVTNVTNIFPAVASPVSNTPFVSLLALGRLQALFQNQTLADQVRSSIPFGGPGGPALVRGQVPDANCPTAEIGAGCRSWLKAYGLTGTVSGDAGFSYQFVGFMGGIDHEINDSTRVGVTATYNKTTANFSGFGSNTDADGFMVGVYGIHTEGDAYVLGSMSYTFNGFGTHGTSTAMGVNTASTASVDQNSYNDYLEAGYTLDYETLRFQPLVGLQYLYLNQNGFVESAGGAATLFGAPQTTEALWLSPGFRLSRPIVQEFGMIAPQFHAQYVRDLLAENKLVSGSLSGVGGAVLTQGAVTGRDFVVAGAGFTIQRGEWLRFILDYTLQTTGVRQTSHTGSGSIQILW